MANPWDNDEVVSVTESVSSSPWEMDEVIEGRVVDLPQVNALPPRATDNMSGYELSMAGLGKSIVDTGYGFAQQAIALPSASIRVGRYLSRQFLPEGSRLRELNEMASSALLAPQDRLRATAADRRAIDADLMRTGAGLAGNIAGTAAQVIGPGLAARGSSLAALALPTSIRGSAAQGAILGTLQPNTGTADQVGNAALAGVAGGAGAGLFRAGGSAIGALRNMASGMSASDRRAAAELSRFATNPGAVNVVESAVPGVQRTLGEATLDPGLMALENTMRARNRGAFDALDLQNNAARVQQLQGIAGTEGDMLAAEAARDATSASLRDRAFAEAESVADPNSLASGLQSLKEGIAEISQQGAGNPNVQNATNAVGRALDQAGNSLNGLYNVRKYIGDLLNGKAAGDDASARAASRELIQIRDLLDSELSRRAPSFSEYLDAYRQGSKPINRMEVGREVISRASGAIPDAMGNPALTPAAFMRATNDLDAIAARATGFKKADASKILTPDDIAAISAIQDDMARIAARGRSATPGSQTAERLSIGEQIGRSSLKSRLPFVGGVFEHFERSANEQLQEKLAYLIANPAEAKKVLAALPAQQAGEVRKLLNQLSLAAGRSAAVSQD